MDPRLFFSVILPLIVTGLVLIAITTLQKDESNFVNELVRQTKKSDGKPVINLLEFTDVCDSCKKRGKGVSCYHKRGNLPWWHKEEQHRDLEKLYKGREDDFLAEIKGVAGESTNSPAFNLQDLALMKDPSRIQVINSNQKHIYVSIDPAAGGNRSKYAIVTAIYDGQKMIVRSNLFFWNFLFFFRSLDLSHQDFLNQQTLLAQLRITSKKSEKYQSIFTTPRL